MRIDEVLTSPEYARFRELVPQSHAVDVSSAGMYMSREQAESFARLIGPEDMEFQLRPLRKALDALVLHEIKTNGELGVCVDRADNVDPECRDDPEFGLCLTPAGRHLNFVDIGGGNGEPGRTALESLRVQRLFYVDVDISPAMVAIANANISRLNVRNADVYFHPCLAIHDKNLEDAFRVTPSAILDLCSFVRNVAAEVFASLESVMKDDLYLGYEKSLVPLRDALPEIRAQKRLYELSIDEVRFRKREGLKAKLPFVHGGYEQAEHVWVDWLFSLVSVRESHDVIKNKISYLLCKDSELAENKELVSHWAEMVHVPGWNSDLNGGARSSWIIENNYDSLVSMLWHRITSSSGSGEGKRLFEVIDWLEEKARSGVIDSNVRDAYRRLSTINLEAGKSLLTSVDILKERAGKSEFSDCLAYEALCEYYLSMFTIVNDKFLPFTYDLSKDGEPPIRQPNVWPFAVDHALRPFERVKDLSKVLQEHWIPIREDAMHEVYDDPSLYKEVYICPTGVVADITSIADRAVQSIHYVGSHWGGATVAAFLGQTLGNFENPALELRKIASALEPGDYLLLGVDLVPEDEKQKVLMMQKYNSEESEGFVRKSGKVPVDAKYEAHYDSRVVHIGYASSSGFVEVFRSEKFVLDELLKHVSDSGLKLMGEPVVERGTLKEWQEGKARIPYCVLAAQKV
jgi:SAM-dependent methyltransferase